MSVLHVVIIFFRAFMVGQTALAAENLGLHHRYCRSRLAA